MNLSLRLLQANLNNKQKAASGAELFTDKLEIMNLHELQSKFPDLYNQVVGIGVQQENTRVMKILPYFQADPKKVTEAISTGKAFSPSEMEELYVKANVGPSARQKMIDAIMDRELDKTLNPKPVRFASTAFGQNV